MDKHSLKFEHEKTVLKYYLIGKGYFTAIKALGYIEMLETRLPPEKRFRKDNVTPSLHHQVRIALSIIALKDIENEELCLTCALLHDVQEDFGISRAEIEAEFGREVAEITWKLTKKYINTVKNKEDYVYEMSICQVASIVKGEDRLDNLYSMIGVFTSEKQLQYSSEAEKLFLPMLKSASKFFPSQIHAYNQIMVAMKRQIEFTRCYVSSLNEVESLKLQLEKVNQDRSREGECMLAENTRLKLEVVRLNSDRQQYLSSMACASNFESTPSILEAANPEADKLNRYNLEV